MAEKVAKKKVKKSKKKSTTKAKKAKKSDVQTEIGITITKKIMGQPPKELHFRLSSGQTIANIFDLATSLRNMNEETFKHHVTHKKNDFANWVGDVFKEKDFASHLNEIKEKIEFENACLRKILEDIKVVLEKKAK